jgi:hypothetical protein
MKVVLLHAPISYIIILVQVEFHQCVNASLVLAEIGDS